jgi:hypothetical protein
VENLPPSCRRVLKFKEPEIPAERLPMNATCISGGFDVSQARPKAPPSQEQRHDLACLEKCKAAVVDLVDQMDKAAGRVSQNDAAAFHELRRNLVKGSQAIFAGIQSLARDGATTPACVRLISDMRDPARSPLPRAIATAVVAVRSIGVSIPAALAQTVAIPVNPDRKQSAEDRALQAAIDSADALKDACSDVISEITANPDDPTQLERENAKRCSASLAVAEVVTVALQDAIVDALGAKPSQSKPAAKARPARQMFRHPIRTTPPAVPLTAQQRAEREWHGMNMLQRSQWIDAATFVRQRTKEITRSV